LHHADVTGCDAVNSARCHGPDCLYASGRAVRRPHALV